MSENSFYLERYFWYKSNKATQKNRLNSTFYQIQLGISHVASYFDYFSEFDQERLDFEEQAARASLFCGTGIHKTDVLVLIPMDAAYERYVPQDHKYWKVGPCIVAPGQGQVMQALEKAYGEVLLRLEDARFDFDLIDSTGLQECKIRGNIIASPYETFGHLVIFDSGYFAPEIEKQIKTFLANGGTVTAVQTDLPTVFCQNCAEVYPDQFLYTDYMEVCKMVQKGHAEPVLQIEEGPSVRVRKSETEDAELWFIHNRGEACSITVNERGSFYLMTTAWKHDGEIIVSDGAFLLSLDFGEAVMLVRRKYLTETGV